MTKGQGATYGSLIGSAAGMYFGPAGAAVGSQLGGALGSILGSDDGDNSAELQRQAMQLLLDAGEPPDVARALILEKYQALGMPQAELAPEVEQAVTKMSGVNADPRLKQAQMQALQSLQGVGSSGMRPEDRAMLMEANDLANQEAKSQQATILQNMQQRGMSGSGAEIAAMLGSQQGNANAGLRNAMKASGDASQRALAAIGQAGQLSGQMDERDFQQQSSKAEAEDSMNRFNIQNMMQRNSANIDRLNRRNEADFSNRQNASNLNTSASNAELARQQAARMQMYDADLRRRGAAASGMNNYATSQQNRANQEAGQGLGIANAVSQGFGSYANYQTQQENNQANKDHTAALNKLAEKPSPSFGGEAYQGNQQTPNPYSLPTTGLLVGKKKEWGEK